MISTPWLMTDKIILIYWSDIDQYLFSKGISTRQAKIGVGFFSQSKNKVASLVLRHDKSRVRTASLFLSPC